MSDDLRRQAAGLPPKPPSAGEGPGLQNIICTKFLKIVNTNFVQNNY